MLQRCPGAVDAGAGPRCRLMRFFRRTRSGLEGLGAHLLTEMSTFRFLNEEAYASVCLRNPIFLSSVNLFCTQNELYEMK